MNLYGNAEKEDWVYNVATWPDLGFVPVVMIYHWRTEAPVRSEPPGYAYFKIKSDGIDFQWWERNAPADDRSFYAYYVVWATPEEGAFGG